MTNLDLQQSEAITLPEATIYILHADKTKSLGFLRLQPNSELNRHNRPVEEWLVQVEGTSIINLYEDNKLIRQVVLNRGDNLKIPANQYHQHANQTDDESLTSWHFDGDIMSIIEQLRS